MLNIEIERVLLFTGIITDPMSKAQLVIHVEFVRMIQV